MDMAQFYTVEMMDGRRLLMEVVSTDLFWPAAGLCGIWRATLQ